MRRFFNDKFMDSPVTMAAVEEDDACLQSTQLPFYQRGCHFSSEAAWLVDFNDDHTTPPRRRPPPPSPRRTSTTANSSSKREGSSKRHATTSASAAAAGREERGRSMFYRLDASERALLRTHVTVTRRHAADAAASHRALLAAETALRRFLLDHATASAEGTTSSSSAPAADLASPGREIASSEAGEWEHVSEADEWLLVSRAEAETTAAEDNEAVDFAVARASALASAPDSVPNSTRDGAAARSRESRRRRRASTRARAGGAEAGAARALRSVVAPQCVLGVASDAHTAALLRAVGRFYGVRVVARAAPAALAVSPGAHTVVATLPAVSAASAGRQGSLVATAAVSLSEVLGLGAGTASASVGATPVLPPAHATTEVAAGAPRRRLDLNEAVELV